METLITTLLLFGGSIFWTIAVIAVFIIICFIADIAENGFYATLALIVLGIIYYLWGHYPAVIALFSWSMLIGYLIIGLVYSILRTYVAGMKLGQRLKKVLTEAQIAEKNKKDNEGYISIHESRESQISVYKDRLKNNISRWWFLWPISLINWVIGDLLKDVWTLIYHWMRDFYDNILDLGINAVLGKNR